MQWDLVIKLAVSLIAIVALAGFARCLRLGGDTRIVDDAAARALAAAHLPGFDSVAVARDRAGYSALVRDDAHNHAIIFKHGAHFAARRIFAGVEARLDQALLTIALPDPGIAAVTLNLGDAAQYWAAGLRHLPVRRVHG